MGALLDLWKSERGVVAVALIAAATTLCGLGTITVEQWLDYTKWIFVTYAAAKTITGSVAIAKGAPTSGPDIWQQIEPLIVGAVTRATTKTSPDAKAPDKPPWASTIVPPQAG